MQIAKLIDESGKPCVGRVDGDSIEIVDLAAGGLKCLSCILKADDPSAVASSLQKTSVVPVSQAKLLPPIDNQEVWAAGVTYKRSQTARMEESEAAASCYDRVYNSPRPEIFFKATPHRVRGHADALRIREDATWNVPEPELALVLSPKLKIVGYTIGNDMSSRDIEGDNPLYLPQAKMYDQCCGLGPWITLADSMPAPAEIDIDLKIHRSGEVVFDQATSVSEMARTFDDLVGWLGRDNSFPSGAFLLTGTGIVPDSNFTLKPRDTVVITISGIGALSNTIVQG
ncbi:MAG: fumarylacetoacetate hydrolase family protein [Aureliella sp.]